MGLEFVQTEWILLKILQQHTRGLKEFSHSCLCLSQLFITFMRVLLGNVYDSHYGQDNCFRHLKNGLALYNVYICLGIFHSSACARRIQCTNSDGVVRCYILSMNLLYHDTLVQ